jgi:hypothetical protein
MDDTSTCGSPPLRIIVLGSDPATYRVQLHGVNDKGYFVLQQKRGEVQRNMPSEHAIGEGDWHGRRQRASC